MVCMSVCVLLERMLSLTLNVLEFAVAGAVWKLGHRNQWNEMVIVLLKAISPSSSPFSLRINACNKRTKWVLYLYDHFFFVFVEIFTWNASRLLNERNECATFYEPKIIIVEQKRVILLLLLFFALLSHENKWNRLPNTFPSWLSYRRLKSTALLEFQERVA